MLPNTAAIGANIEDKGELSHKELLKAFKSYSRIIIIIIKKALTI